MGEREYAGPGMLWCFVGKWVGRAKPGIYQNNLGNFLLEPRVPNPQPRLFFLRQRASTKGNSRTFLGTVVFMAFFFISFSGVEMPKYGGQARKCPKLGLS